VARLTVRKGQHEARKPTSIDETIGKHIRRRRRMLEMTQDELARAIGVNFQQVQKYEAGNNRLSASRLAKIAEVLDAPIAWFFRDDSLAKEVKVQVDDALVNLLAALAEGSRQIQLGKPSGPRTSRLLPMEGPKSRRRRRNLSR